MKSAKTTKVAKRPNAGGPALPTAKSTPSNEMGDYSVLLYGREKIGKTSFASHFPDALFLMFEPGGRALEIFQMPVTSWKEFRQILVQLEGTNDYETIVIDTIDLAHQFCNDAVCKRMGISHPSDEKWGKGWASVRDEFAKALHSLLHQVKPDGTRRGVVFISHEKEKTLTRASGTEETRIVPSMSNQARDVIEPVVDLWVYYGRNDADGRYLQVEGDEMVSAGHRMVGRFQNLTAGKVPAGSSAEEAHKNFTAAFSNRAPSSGETSGLKKSRSSSPRLSSGWVRSQRIKPRRRTGRRSRRNVSRQTRPRRVS